jgi:hypothetical protein
MSNNVRVQVSRGTFKDITPQIEYLIERTHNREKLDEDDDNTTFTLECIEHPFEEQSQEYYRKMERGELCEFRYVASESTIIDYYRGHINGENKSRVIINASFYNCGEYVEGEWYYLTTRLCLECVKGRCGCGDINKPSSPCKNANNDWLFMSNGEPAWIEDDDFNHEF